MQKIKLKKEKILLSPDLPLKEQDIRTNLSDSPFSLCTAVKDNRQSSKFKHGSIKCNLVSAIDRTTTISVKQLEKIDRIEKILKRRRNLKLKGLVRKPKWITESENKASFEYLDENVQNNFVAEVDELNVGNIPNINFDINDIANNSLDTLSNEKCNNGVKNNSMNTLSDEKCNNYIRRKWKRRDRKTLTESLPKDIVNCFRSLKRSFGSDLTSSITTLTEVLKDKFISLESESVTFSVLKYFSNIDTYNSIHEYKKKKDPSVLFSPFEQRIVSILLDLESLSEKFADLLLLVVINIRQLVLSVHNLTLTGSCALCRLYTLICKTKNNRKEATSFCCQILKINHKYGPMLLASIVGTWTELFSISYDLPEEEVVFYGSLRLNAQTLPCLNVPHRNLPLSDWKVSKDIIEKYMSAAIINPSEDHVDFLIESIQEMCMKGTYANEFLLTTPLILFTANTGWHWAKEFILDKHLLRIIFRCADSRNNPRALAMLFNLYAEISLFAPKNEKPEKMLSEYFKAGKGVEGDEHWQDAAAPAHIQLLLSRDESLPEELSVWYQMNERNPKFAHLNFHFHRRCLANKTDFAQEDLL